MWMRRILHCHYFWLCDLLFFSPFCWQNNSCSKSILSHLAETVSPYITKDGTIVNNLDNKKTTWVIRKSILKSQYKHMMAPLESDHKHTYIMEDFVFSGSQVAWMDKVCHSILLSFSPWAWLRWTPEQDRTQRETIETDLMTWKLLTIVITSRS